MAEKSKLDSAFAQIEKEVGKGVVVDAEGNEDVQRVVLSSMGLNYIFNGGFPKGRIVEFFGPESGGKSLLATAIAADYQKEGSMVVYIDMEGTFMGSFAKKQGLSLAPSVFRLVQPESGEDAFQILETLAETGEVGLVVVDSVAAMTPRSELEGDYGEASMGSMARMMSQGMRKINGLLTKSNTSVIFVNQIRQKIGVMYGNPETTTGGKALQFYASSRSRVSRKETLKNGTENIGVQMGVVNKKSKVGPPLREFVTNVYFDSGVDTTSELASFASKFEIITKSGSWYDLPNGERVQGKDNVAKYIAENPEFEKQLFSQIFEQLFGLQPTTNAVTDTPDQTKQEAPKKKRSSKKKKPDEEAIELDDTFPESPDNSQEDSSESSSQEDT